MSDLLTIAGNTYSSRLLIGTGKYKDFEENPRRHRKPAEQKSSLWPFAVPTLARTRTSPTCSTTSPRTNTPSCPNTAGCFNRRRCGAVLQAGAGNCWMATTW